LAGGAIAVGGCGDTAEAGSTVGSSPAAAAASAPVTLHLDAGSYSLASPTTTITGTATRGSRVTVNGHRASMRGNRWSETLHLHLGPNRVIVEATLKGHRAARKAITVTREETPAELEVRTPTPEAGAQALQSTTPQSTTPPSTTPATSTPGEACTNGTYVNSAGNTVCRPEESPSAPAGATAQCVDGTYSFSQSRSGTCSHHGGVARWLS
jgi:Tfp pilus assembly protein FimV